MARILWHSVSPLAGTGYGQQTAIFTPRIRDLGHDVALSAYWGVGNHIGWDDMLVYPSDDEWGNRMMPRWAEHHRADLVITLMDVWVLKGDRLKDRLKGRRIASWVPVDHEPCPDKVLKYFEKSGATPIAMSRFGERMLSDAGLDPLYVPHGIDTNVLRPRPETRAASRKLMNNIPPDAFVVGMVAANKGDAPSRKAFPQALQAFAEFRKHHSDAFLYLHTDPVGRANEHGVGIPRLADRCGLPDESIIFTDTLALEFGMTAEQMSEMYSSFDCLLAPSYGEGFGIPIVEAQSCGVPVVVTDCTAMSELCGDGVKVGGDPWYDAPQGAFWKSASIAGIVDALEEMYARPRGPSVKAREFALGYDADRVLREYWVPALAALTEKPAAVAA